MPQIIPKPCVKLGTSDFGLPCHPFPVKYPLTVVGRLFQHPHQCLFFFFFCALSACPTYVFIQVGFFASSVVGLPYLLGTQTLWPHLYTLELSEQLQTRRWQLPMGGGQNTSKSPLYIRGSPSPPPFSDGACGNPYHRLFCKEAVGSSSNRPSAALSAVVPGESQVPPLSGASEGGASHLCPLREQRSADPGNSISPHHQWQWRI